MTAHLAMDEWVPPGEIAHLIAFLATSNCRQRTEATPAVNGAGHMRWGACAAKPPSGCARSMFRILDISATTKRWRHGGTSQSMNATRQISHRAVIAG